MNPEAQAELNRILALDPNDVTESDAAFLRARRSYLSEEQLAVFAEALGSGSAETNAAKSSDESPRSRRGKAVSSEA